MDEGESHVGQGRSDAVQYYGMQRDVALGPRFERVSVDRERVQREGPGEVESPVAAPKTPIPEPQPPLKTTEGLLYCLSKLSSRVRITKIFPPIPSNAAVISRMGERISGSRDVLQNYQKISRGC